MTYAVKEFATVPLSDDPSRASMQLKHLVSLIGEEKVFMIVFKLPELDKTSAYVEPDDNFVQTTGTQAGLTVELMKNGKLFTLGHQGETGQQVMLPRKDGTSVEVSHNEVLSPDEVGQLLVEYVETNAIDTSRWSLREIALADDAAAAADQDKNQAQATPDDRKAASGFAPVSKSDTALSKSPTVSVSEKRASKE